MNTRSKLITALAVSLAVTAGAAATSTFAWFRVTRTSEVNVANASIWGEGDMEIAYSKTGDYEGASYGGVDSLKNGFKMTGVTNSATDVSGNGIDMYKPNWDKTVAVTEEKALEIKKVTNGLVGANATYYYILFGIKVTNKGTTAFNLYWSEKSTVSAVDSSNAADAASAKSIRVAMWQGTSVLSTWQPDSTDGSANTNYNYIVPGIAGTDTLYDVDGYKMTSPDAASFHTGAFTKIAAAAAGDAVPGQKIIAVPASGSATFNCSIWIEGTLASATKVCIGGHVNVNLGFVGL